MKRKLILLFSGLSACIFLDQFTKYLIVKTMAYGASIPVFGDWVRLTFIYNENGAFGLKPHRLLPFLSPALFFSIFPVLAAGVVLWMYFTARDREWRTEIPLILILGGALGNFIDRLRLGRVVDFIDCEFPDIIMDRFPIFNVADSCITVGVFVLILTSLFVKNHAPSDTPSNH